MSTRERNLEKGLKLLRELNLAKVLKLLLGIAWWALIAFLSFSMFMVIGNPERISLEDHFPVHITGDAPEELGLKWEATDLGHAKLEDLVGHLDVSDSRSPMFWGLRLFILFLFPGVSLTIIFQLRKFLQSIASGSPFTEDSMRRIAVIGVVIICFETARYLHLLAFDIYLRRTFAIAGRWIEADVRFNYLTLLLGLLLLVIAKTFEIGMTMRKEQELTI